MSSVQCIYCGEIFTAQRSTAKYCSTGCRVAYHRLSDQIVTYRDIAISAIEKMIAIESEYPEFLLPVDKALSKIRSHEIELTAGDFLDRVIHAENEIAQSTFDKLTGEK